MVLDKIQRPNDVKELKEQELPILADEIRQFIIDKVSDMVVILPRTSEWWS